MKKNSPPNPMLTAPLPKPRFVFVVLFFAAWALAIAGKLFLVQIVQHQRWVEQAAIHQTATIDVAARRGFLYDRNLKELAMTVQEDSIFAVPKELGENRESAAEMLASIVHTDPMEKFTSKEQMLARFTASTNFAWVARKVDPETSQRIHELNLKGVYSIKEPKRFYPNNELAAQVLGYVGTDDKGLGGLELNFEDNLSGIPGKKTAEVDRKGHAIGSQLRAPVAGENLVLSIDSNIQYMAERALDEQMAKVKAAHGTVVVQDPHTGQILALAVSPRFNPNDKRHMDASVLQNLAVSDVYEPGSTFKLVSYAAAIDGAGVQPTDMVNCEGGAWTLMGRTLHDDKSDGRMGMVTVQYALEKSSDVGAAKMVQKVGNEKFYNYMRAFGFGQRSGIELPSETRGLLRSYKKWEPTSFMSLAIGQEVGVTPVQLAAMVSTIANGGIYMPPHILLQSTDRIKGDAGLQPAAFHPANQLPAVLPEGAHRVIKEMTSAKMREMMRGIVVEGTGKAAALNGYSAGGKTGTANKIDVQTHTYSHTKLVASFAGLAPVSNPAITVAVVIDTPTVGSLYGAAVSAPVFAQVAQEVLEYLGVPHDQPLKTKKELQLAAAAQPDVFDSAPESNGADLNAMFADINSLPAEDPIRAAATSNSALAESAEPTKLASNNVPASLSDKILADFRANGNTTSTIDVGETKVPISAPKFVPVVQARSSGGVVVDAGHRVAVPAFDGAALRSVIEQAAHVGLRVQPVGSGLAHQQVPAAGTMVPVGTEIVVRFSR